ncbi:MAG: hypothetical protein ACP5RW_08385 [bacterium]
MLKKIQFNIPVSFSDTFKGLITETIGVIILILIGSAIIFLISKI